MTRTRHKFSDKKITYHREFRDAFWSYVKDTQNVAKVMENMIFPDSPETENSQRVIINKNRKKMKRKSDQIEEFVETIKDVADQLGFNEKTDVFIDVS